MYQILQNLKTGKTELVQLPVPAAQPGNLLIQSRTSLISAGTEKMLVEFSRSSLIGKAKAQPDKVRQVLDKVRTEGLLPTLETVFNRLDEPLPLGYCNAGKIVETCERVNVGTFKRDHVRTFERLNVGDRVVSNGAHAEMVSVPCNLCVRIPDGVSDEQAAFTVLASIGLQGVRLAQPTLEEKFVVYGLGLIGLITVQLLRANGCEVLGIDLNAKRLELAEQYGAKTLNAGQNDPVAAAEAWTKGKGVDGVLITASAKNNEIIHHSAQMCRKRGRVVLVGVVGLNLQRADFYEKEISFQVSCSYGPGRYDDAYELKGQDYPYGFVRWTEQRNFEAVLQLMRSGKLDVDALISHRIPFNEAPKAYELIQHDPAVLGVILQYSKESKDEQTIVLKDTGPAKAVDKATVGLIGAGNFSKMTLMPALAKTDARLMTVSDLKGDAAHHLAKKFGFERATTDYKTILSDDQINAVIIATGHSSHAKLVGEALDAGKHVFVEKPLAMNVAELDQIVRTFSRLNVRTFARSHVHTLTVGFNRRFSPHIQKIKSLLRDRQEPLAMTMTVNAGIIPPDHWVHDPERGGGRIIGEACHFIDLMQFLSGSAIEMASAFMVDNAVPVREDKMSIILSFKDGSVGTVNYFANGSKAYPKERLEIFNQERVLALDNFRVTRGWGFKGFKSFKTRKMDKGHAGEFQTWIEALKAGGPAPIPLNELINSTLASFAAVTAAAEKRCVDIEEYGRFFVN
jgi:predicted dehydrogenase/threonine dehydrogenase-like Zn-dependent dehydrogenase